MKLAVAWIIYLIIFGAGQNAQNIDSYISALKEFKKRKLKQPQALGLWGTVLHEKSGQLCQVVYLRIGIQRFSLLYKKIIDLLFPAVQEDNRSVIFIVHKKNTSKNINTKEIFYTISYVARNSTSPFKFLQKSGHENDKMYFL